MCRLMFYLNHSRIGKEKFHAFLESFYNAGFNDIYLKKVAEKFNVKYIKNTHYHGWGYLYLTGHSLNIYKTGEPFYTDKSHFYEILNHLKRRFLYISLIRTTDIGFISSFESHPFSFVLKTPNKIEEIYLVYNGLVDIEKISNYLGFDLELLKSRNSTYSMLFLLEEFFKSFSDLEESLKKLQSFVKSAANVIVFSVGEENKIYVMHYVKEDLYKDEIVRDYYKMVYLENEDFIFAGNKIILEHYSKLYGDLDFKEFKNGEIKVYDVDFIHKYWFDGYK